VWCSNSPTTSVLIETSSPVHDLLSKDVAAAQAKAWREAADTFKVAAGKVAAARRADLEAALQQMKSDASEAETRLQKLNQVGSESWSVLSTALAESRKAFDQANQSVWDALRGSGSKS
jgi:hypothetical protein